MRFTGWRALLLSLCALVALFAVADIYFEFAGPNSTTLVGQWGDTVGASSTPFHLVVLSTDPGHGADLAGVRPGDLIDIRPNTPVERFWLFGQPPTGHSVRILVRSSTRTREATIVPQSTATFRVFLLTPIWLGFIWIAIFAAIIAWRRFENPQMRMLCVLLIAYGFWGITNQHYVSSEHLWMHVAATAVNVFGSLAVAFWAACSGSFAPPRSRLRRASQWFCYVSITVSIGIGLTKVGAIVTLAVDPVALSSSVAAVPFVLAYLAAAFCAILAMTATRGADRQRAVWTLVPAGILILAGFGAEALQGTTRSYEMAWAIFYVAAAINFVTPLMLTYVAINRRLLDIGFVLNRAAVFAIVSTLVIAIFVIAEWIANEWLSANHTTGAIVGVVVALLLGLSMRYLHHFVDRFVDRVLFRQRHEDEAALRRFAHEAGFITDRDTLLERALAVVKSSTRADASIVLFDNKRTLDENDPALVAMRAWRKPVDLERFPSSALHGQFAFPMVARGGLVGALVCGTKQDSEVYAPDEFEALQSLADGVGNALSVLSPDGADGHTSLAETVADLRAAIKELRDISPVAQSP